MKPPRPLSRVVAVCLLMYPVFNARADNPSIEVTFTASVADTTCLVTVSGGTGDGKNQTIIIGDSSGQVPLDAVLNGDSAASAPFSLLATECPAQLPQFYTTIEGQAVQQGSPMLVNKASGAASAGGLGITLSTADNLTMPLALNQKLDYATLGWTVKEQTNFMQSIEARLVAKLVPIGGEESVKAGNVQATAIFHFDYD